jgi:Outer membrane protein beta-barrel domain
MKSDNNADAQRQGMTHRLCAGLATIIFATAAGTSSAATSGYIGTRVGVSDGGVDSGLGSDSDGFVGELFGGVRLNERWAVELGFFGIDSDLGDYAISQQVTETLQNRSKLRGTALSARYEVPMGSRTRLHLRAGISNLNLDYTLRYNYSVDNGMPPPTVHEGRLELSSDSLGSVLAVGFDTALNDIWSIGAELQSYRGDMRLKTYRDDLGGFRPALDGTGSVQTAVLSLTANF